LLDHDGDLMAIWEDLDGLRERARTSRNREAQELLASTKADNDTRADAIAADWSALQPELERCFIGEASLTEIDRALAGLSDLRVRAKQVEQSKQRVRTELAQDFDLDVSLDMLGKDAPALPGPSDAKIAPLERRLLPFKNALRELQTLASLKEEPFLLAAHTQKLEQTITRLPEGWESWSEAPKMRDALEVARKKWGLATRAERIMWEAKSDVGSTGPFLPRVGTPLHQPWVDRVMRLWREAG
jgi:hypothetical protein